MRLTTAVVGAAMVMWATAAAAQKPDFSGKWTVDTEKTQAANPGQPGGGGPPGGGGGGRFGAGPMTLKQDAASLTAERETPNGVQSTVYKFDGSETVVTSQRGESRSKAAWDGANLVITTTRPGMDGGTMTTKQTYSKEGEYLVVTMQGSMGGQDFTRKTYYKKGS